MIGQTVYVVTAQNDDPFVAGGVPSGAFMSEQEAWNRIAEATAMLSGPIRERNRGMTWADAYRNAAAMFTIYPLEVTG